MKPGDRVKTPLGFRGTITSLFELSDGKGRAHITFDPSPDPDVFVPEVGAYPISLLTPLRKGEENDADTVEF